MKNRITENEAYEKALQEAKKRGDYRGAKYHNSFLQSLPKEARSIRVCESVFMSANGFDLFKEFENVPSEAKTETLLMYFVAARPKAYAIIPPERRSFAISVLAICIPGDDTGVAEANYRLLPDELKSAYNWDEVRREYIKTYDTISKMAILAGDKGNTDMPQLQKRFQIALARDNSDELVQKGIREPISLQEIIEEEFFRWVKTGEYNCFAQEEQWFRGGGRMAAVKLAELLGKEMAREVETGVKKPDIRQVFLSIGDGSGNSTNGALKDRDFKGTLLK